MFALSLPNTLVVYGRRSRSAKSRRSSIFFVFPSSCPRVEDAVVDMILVRCRRLPITIRRCGAVRLKGATQRQRRPGRATSGDELSGVFFTVGCVFSPINPTFSRFCAHCSALFCSLSRIEPCPISSLHLSPSFIFFLTLIFFLFSLAIPFHLPPSTPPLVPFLVLDPLHILASCIPSSRDSSRPVKNPCMLGFASLASLAFH